MNEISSTVIRKDLSAAVAFASLGLHKHPGLPVLAGMKVSMTAGTVTLAAFDYETYASADVHGDGDGAGAILVDGRDLAAGIKSLDGSTARLVITMTEDLPSVPATLTISCDGTDVILRAMNAGDYPGFPIAPGAPYLADGATFARAVLRAASAAGKDDTLPALTCVHMKSAGGEIEAAGTDRYRLAVTRFGWTGPDGAEMLVPAKPLVAFAKACDTSGKVTIRYADGKVMFSDGDRSVIVSTNPGEYVRYSQLLRPESDQDVTVTADARALADALAWAAKLTGPHGKASIDIGCGLITVGAVNRDGEVKGSRAVPAEATGDWSTGFNATYLHSLVAGYIPAKAQGRHARATVTIGLKRGPVRDGQPGAERPAMLTGDGMTALVVPLRTAG